MNLQLLSRDELWKEFTKASDNYLAVTEDKNLIKLRLTADYIAAKKRLNNAIDELQRRKRARLSE